LTDPREAPVAIRLTAGQAGDNPQLVPLLDDYAAACKQQGASGRDFRLLGDKAYSHPSTRTELRSRRSKHKIPQRSDQIARRKAKGLIGSPVRRDRRAFLVQPSGHAARAWVLWYSLERKQAAATHNRCVNFLVPIPAIHATVGIRR